MWFPKLGLREVTKRYYEAATPKFLLNDGERVFFTLAYKHRRVRYGGVFWAQPRFLRVGSGLLLLLRGYNVTLSNRRPVRTRRLRIRRGLPWLVRPVVHGVERFGWL